MKWSFPQSVSVFKNTAVGVDSTVNCTSDLVTFARDTSTLFKEALVHYLKRSNRPTSFCNFTVHITFLYWTHNDGRTTVCSKSLWLISKKIISTSINMQFHYILQGHASVLDTQWCTILYAFFPPFCAEFTFLLLFSELWRPLTWMLWARALMLSSPLSSRRRSEWEGHFLL